MTQRVMLADAAYTDGVQSDPRGMCPRNKQGAEYTRSFQNRQGKEKSVCPSRSRALGALAGLFAFAAVDGSGSGRRPALHRGSGHGRQHHPNLAGDARDIPALPGHDVSGHMDEAKKQGIIVSYSVYETSPRSADDPNLYLMVTYKNMAALDGLDDRMEGIQQKSFRRSGGPRRRGHGPREDAPPARHENDPRGCVQVTAAGRSRNEKGPHAAGPFL